MVRKRRDQVPIPELSIWKKSGDGWTVRKSDLLEVIRISGISDDELKNRLGRGHKRLSDALDGKILDIWGVKHVEWGLGV